MTLCSLCHDPIDTRGNGPAEFVDHDGDVVHAHEDCATSEDLVAA